MSQAKDQIQNVTMRLSERVKAYPQDTFQTDKKDLKGLKGMPHGSFQLNKRVSKNHKSIAPQQPHR